MPKLCPASIILRSVVPVFIGIFVSSSVSNYPSHFFGIVPSNKVIQLAVAQPNSTLSPICKKGFEPSSSGKECVPSSIITHPGISTKIPKSNKNKTPGIISPQPGTSPLNPIKGTPYEFALKYNSGNFAFARNIIYRIQFVVNDGTFKIADVGKGTFDFITSPTADSIEFHTSQLLKGQSKLGHIVVDFGNAVAKKEVVIHIDTTINGITRTQMVDPGITEALGIGTAIFNFIGSAFNTSFNIYTRVTPCFNLQVSNNNPSPPTPVYSVQMENCAQHPQHVNLSTQDLPSGVHEIFDRQHADIPSNQTRTSHLTLLVPNGLSGSHIFIVNGDVVLNTFGRYFAVTASSGSSYFGVGSFQPSTPPRSSPTPNPTPTGGCFIMIAGHCWW
jgi:hypothetical protein